MTAWQLESRGAAAGRIKEGAGERRTVAVRSMATASVADEGRMPERRMSERRSAAVGRMTAATIERRAAAVGRKTAAKKEGSRCSLIEGIMQEGRQQLVEG